MKRLRTLKSWTKFAPIPLMCLMLLSGCETVPSRVLPDIKPYSKSVMVQAANEIESNTCPALNNFMVDYHIMREQTRALRR